MKLVVLNKSLMLNAVALKNPLYDKFEIAAYTSKGKVHAVGVGQFGARQVIFDNGLKGTLKKKLFSNENFRGIKKDRQYLHEVAYYQLAKYLSIDVVPPTILTTYEDVPASLQLWVFGVAASGLVPDVFKKSIENWKEKVALFTAQVNMEKLRDIILLDLITNNTDRHGKNIIIDIISNNVWAIDNGLSFGKYFSKYYNVFHKYIYRKNFTLTTNERAVLESLTLQQIQSILHRYLTVEEIEQTFKRMQFILKQKDLGFEILCKEHEGRNDFPSYEEWFKTVDKPNKVLLAINKMGILTSNSTMLDGQVKI